MSLFVYSAILYSRLFFWWEYVDDRFLDSSFDIESMMFLEMFVFFLWVWIFNLCLAIIKDLIWTETEYWLTGKKFFSFFSRIYSIAIENMINNILPWGKDACWDMYRHYSCVYNAVFLFLFYWRIYFVILPLIYGMFCP